MSCHAIMKKKLLCILLFCAVLLPSQNLLPPMEDDSWEVGRNADGISSFEITEVDGKTAFHIRMNASSGYTLYRCYPNLEPGREYTFSAMGFGDTASGLFAEAYSFDEAGNPTLILDYHSAAGAIPDPLLMHAALRVPEDSRSVRIGVGVSGAGEAYYTDVRLQGGNLPKPEDAPKEPDLLPVQKRWIAEWIFLKDDPGEPRVDFTKSFELAAEAVSAALQLTADNAYELLVNGKYVGSDVDWKDVEYYDITPFLHKGTNTILVHELNYDGDGGILLQGQVFEADGNVTVIKSDGTWEVSLPHGGPAELDVLGKVPVSPWGNVPFRTVIPPKTVLLPCKFAQREVEAGDVLSFHLVPSQEFLSRKDHDVKFRFTDEAGRIVPLSAYHETLRLVPERQSFFAELATSRYAMPGVYRTELVGNGFVIPLGDVTILPADLPQEEAFRIPRPGVDSLLSTRDFTTTLFTYSTYQKRDEALYRLWTGTSGHMYEINFASGYWLSENYFDYTDAEASLLDILENDPHAGVVLKFRIDVPGWWASRHPGELFHSNNNRMALQSFCSDQWRKDAIEAVGNTLEALRRRPVGRAINGVLLMGFRGGEFQLWGEDVGEYDCSHRVQEAFDRFLDDRGVKRRILLPDPALQFPLAPVDETGAETRDLFFRFVAERQGENMAYFLDAFRARFGMEYAIGMYFGYGLEYCGNNARMLLAGHLGLEDMLNRASPDMVSCPLSYGIRTPDSSHGYMYPVDSLRLHGVLPIGENDVRNYRNPEVADSSGNAILTLRESIQENRRIRIFQAMHGAMVRYLALHPLVDWFSDPPMIRAIHEDNDLVKTLRANPVGGEERQVVLVANYSQWTRGWRLPDKLFSVFAGKARDTLMRTGRPVSFLTFADYETRVTEWDNALIPAPGLLSKEQKDSLEKAGGKLPIILPEDGALVRKGGKWDVLHGDATSLDIWKTFATPEALEEGYGTIWYVGPDYTYTWDGNALERR